MIERLVALVQQWLQRRWLLPTLLGVLIVLGAALLFVNPLFLIVGIIALLVGAAVLSQPYYGVLLYLFLLYVRPGDMFPPLEPLRLTLLGVALLAAAWILQVLVYRRVQPLFTMPMFLMCCFLFVIGLSIFTSYNQGLTLTRFTDLLRVVFMTYLIVHVVDTVPRLKGFMTTLVLILAGLSTAIVIRFFLFPETRIEGKGGSGGIAGGFLGDGNDYALAQTVFLPWALALAATARHRLLKPLLLYAVFIGMFAIGVTYSRGGFLGLAAVLVAYYTSWVLRTRRYAFGLFGGVVGVALLLIALLAFAPPDFLERMGTIKKYDQDESAMGRIDAWHASGNMFKDHPFVGVGAGSFSDAYGKQYKPANAVSNVWREAHSVFFQVLGELGMFGILTLYGLVISIGVAAFKLRGAALADAEEERFFHAVRSALPISLLGWLICSLFLSVAYYPHLFVLVMVVAVLDRLARTRALVMPEVEEVEVVEEGAG